MENKRFLSLSRQSVERPELRSLEDMCCRLRDALDINADPSDPKWNSILEEVIEFRASDGSFNLFDSYDVPSDIRVIYCHEPTYICTCLLIKASLADSSFIHRNHEIVAGALKACTYRELAGHGYDEINAQLNALEMFIKAGVKDFLIRYPDECSEFTIMMEKITDGYIISYNDGAVFDDWGVDYSDRIKYVIDNLSELLGRECIFVYGTLLKGHRNYDSYLAPLEPVLCGTIDGFRMYDLGSFPGIIRGEGKVKGEVYWISHSLLERIDELEGEGTLYKRTLVNVMSNDGIKVEAYVYVYNGNVSEHPEIAYDNQPYAKDLVWYVSYGSNMLEERFKCYIQGGHCRFNGKKYAPCDDLSAPVAETNVEIPYNMYFGNFGLGSWSNSAVSFLDISKPGKALGHAYLIHKDQLEHIHSAEGKGRNWYPDVVELAEINGIKSVTFSNKISRVHEPLARVSAEYGSVLFLGIKECYPEMSDYEIFEYLRSCGE